MTNTQRIERLERTVEELTYAIHLIRSELAAEREQHAVDAYSKITIPLTKQPFVTTPRWDSMTRETVHAIVVDQETGELRIEEQ